MSDGITDASRESKKAVDEWVKEEMKKLLSTFTTKDLIDEIERRIDPNKEEYEPGAITVHDFHHSEEGVINKFVPYGYEGTLKRPENLQYGIYNARIIVVRDDDQ